MNKEKGFTLLEILVVFAIIGLLSAAAASSFTNAQQKARDATRKSDLSQLRTALELSKSDSGSSLYPFGTGNTYTTSLYSYLETNHYMNKSPKDPKNSTASDYGYYYHSDDGTTYELIACLENSRDVNKDSSPKSYCNTPKTGISITYTPL